MFNFLKLHPPMKRAKQSNKNIETVALKLSGLHCTSCATNIDLTLEDLSGVISSNTNYAKSELIVSFDPLQTNHNSIKKTIIDLGYKIE